VSEEKEKPVLDEQMLGKLLEAAYVLQEHNRAMQKLGLNLERQRERLNEQAPHPPVARPPLIKNSSESAPAPDDYTFTLAQIVETQRLIQVRRLDLEEAIAMVAERVASIASASGAGIGILERKKVRYRAGVGDLALPAGTEVAMEKALCVACIRTGQVIRCTDVNPEFLLDAEECHRRGIASIIAVPVYHDGGIAGGLEVYYPHTNAFTEQDVHTCQLMAGLVTEALAREEEQVSKNALAAERALMLETADKLKLKPSVPDSGAAPVRKKRTAGASSLPIFACLKCGHDLVGEEQFCGRCGTPRGEEGGQLRGRTSPARRPVEGVPAPAPADTSVSAPVRPPVSPSVNRSAKTAGANASTSGVLPRDISAKPQEAGINEFLTPLAITHDEVGGAPEAEVVSNLPAPRETGQVVAESDLATEGMVELPDADLESSEMALVKTSTAVAWTSAANAREFLEQLAVSDHPNSLAHFWKARRADVYLAIAVVLMIGVIRWGIWSNHSVGATGSPTNASAAHRKAAPDSDLSFFDRMLISLGLAEPPPTPEYKGNPDTEVWVDLHTALYYCPGTDLYGKTAKGKFATQRDAQLDQFEPAYRKACD
jgi:GAF domain-containing protein